MDSPQKTTITRFQLSGFGFTFEIQRERARNGPRFNSGKLVDDLVAQTSARLIEQLKAQKGTTHAK